MDDSNLEDYNFDEKVGFKDKDKDHTQRLKNNFGRLLSS